MFVIKVILTFVLSLIGVIAAWLVADNQVVLSLSGFIIGLSSYLFSDWFVDWVKENV